MFDQFVKIQVDSIGWLIKLNYNDLTNAFIDVNECICF